jgi:signal transduction histidine kinase/ABC-type amino acid transport substrate-binding protein
MRTHTVLVALALLVIGTILVGGCTNTADLPSNTSPATPTPTPASASGSPEDLVAFVERAFEYAHVYGRDAALREFNDPAGRFVEGELYIFAYDLEGNTLALPFQPELIGTNRWNATDPDGTAFIQELIDTAQSDGGFVRYRYPDPADNDTVKEKLSYVMPVDRDWVIGSGIYEPWEEDPIVSVGADPRVREGLKSFVAEAIAYADENGKDAALAEFNDRNGTFVRGNLYIYAFDYNGTTLALPHQPQLIGTDLSDLQDPFGVNYTRVEIFLARQGGGFIYYHYPNPARNMTVEPKMSYVAPVDDTWWLGAGIYLLDVNRTAYPDEDLPAAGSIRNLTFYTEQLPPFNYQENGTLQGISVDLLEAATERMGQKVSREEVRLVPWTEAYRAGLRENNTTIFMAGRVPQRESLFKWAGPIYTNHNVLFARPGEGITIRSPEDLEGYRIGVIADDITVQQLLDLGVNRSQLVQETSVPTLIGNLESGEIDLWGYSEATGRYFAEKETGNYYAFTIAYSLPALEGYYAFSTDVPDSTVQAFQQALDALKAEKDTAGISAYQRIVRRYIPPSESGMTPDDLAAFVRNASEYAATAGEEVALAEFQRQDGRFSQGDVYIYAYDFNGTLLAHPYQADLVGTNRSDWTDARGLPFVRVSEYVASNGGGYIAYLYPSPEGGVIDEKALDTYEPKIGYVSPVGEAWWIGSGIYFSDMAPTASGRPQVVSDMIGLVEASAAYGREHEAQNAFAEISNSSGVFVDADGHYIYAYDYNGTLLAHPYLPEKVGSSLIERTDPFGMKNIRALADTARSGGGYVVFVWQNPDNGNREELKIGYVLPVDETWWVGSGVYLSEITGEGTFLSPA